MKLYKFFTIMVVITVLALAYIHIQMQIVDLAYQGNQKEQRIKKLVEENGSAMYKILTLKSVNHLGVTMLDKDSGMQFANSRDVVRIIASEEFALEDRSGKQPKLAKKVNPLLSLLSFGVEAEAKTAK